MKTIILTAMLLCLGACNEVPPSQDWAMDAAHQFTTKMDAHYAGIVCHQNDYTDGFANCSINMGSTLYPLYCYHTNHHGDYCVQAAR